MVDRDKVTNGTAGSGEGPEAEHADVPSEGFYWELAPGQTSEPEVVGEQEELYLAWDILYGRKLLKTSPALPDPQVEEPGMTRSDQGPNDECEYQDAISALLAAAWYDDSIDPAQLADQALSATCSARHNAREAAK